MAIASQQDLAAAARQVMNQCVNARQSQGGYVGSVGKPSTSLE